MINKSFITSTELSGQVAAKAHYLMVKGFARGFDKYLEKVKDFSKNISRVLLSKIYKI